MSGAIPTHLHLGGVRIELAEIEQVIDGQPGVRGSVVVAVDTRSFEELMAMASKDVLSASLNASSGAEDPAGALHAALAAAMPSDDQLVAHIESDDTVSVDSVRQAVGAQLPPAHAPVRVAIHSQLPRTTNGEIDRAACQVLAVPVATEHQDAATVDLAASRRVDAAALPPDDVISVQLSRASRPTNAPFFALHNIGTNGQAWRPFAELVGEHHDVYALSDPLAVLTPLGDLIEVADEPFSVLRTAQLYAREIMRRQPVGPVILAGYCLGGMLVHETSQQLAAAGRAPLLNVILADWQAPFLQGDLSVAEKFALGQQRTGDSAIARLANLARAGTAVNFVRREAERKIATTLDRIGVRIGGRLELALSMQQGLNAIAAYEYKQSSVPALVVRPADDPRSPASLGNAGWRDLLPDLTVAYVPGMAHELLMPERVKYVVEAVNSRVESVRNK